MIEINLRVGCCPLIAAFLKIIGFIKKIIVGNLPFFVKPNQGFAFNRGFGLSPILAFLS
jgi:hypothetical protein